MIRKAIITAAGLGTRLLPMSKEVPKEMLPIFVEGRNGLVLKPMLQAIFEQLYDFGVREFCLVVGRGKRLIEDHFTPDYGFLDELHNGGRRHLAEELNLFYSKIDDSRVIWVNQPKPKGFGDALLRAEGFGCNEDFLVAAGDTYMVSKKGDYLRRLSEGHLGKSVDVALMAMEVSDPEHYGIMETSVEGDCLRVLSVEEKPARPKTRMAVMPFYIFYQNVSSSLFDAIRSLRPGVGGEIQLTDAINSLIKSGSRVYATQLLNEESRLDIGTPEKYWDALRLSYSLLTNGQGHL
jgi:UTP--glucose-1-phosphate uridylyltransferase